MAMTRKRNPSAGENLRLIRGISRPIERRLHEEGILTCAQLALLTPQAISAILGGVNGCTTKRIIKEDWIKQARELSSLSESPEPKEMVVGAEESSAVKRQRLTSFVIELLVDEEGQSRRTKIMHIDSGREDTWAGWQERRLAEFIIESAGLSPSAAETRLPAAPSTGQTPQGRMLPETVLADRMPSGPTASTEPGIEEKPQIIEMITVKGQPTSQGSISIPSPAKRAAGTLPANQPFEVRLALDPTEIGSLEKKPLDYQATLYAKNLQGFLRKSVGEANGHLEPAENRQIVIKGVPLPQGLYRLQAVIDLSDQTKQRGRRPSSSCHTGEKLFHVA
jgi:hypothetical protein